MRLRTFGGLWIEAEGAPALGPRPLALLALVAAADRKGISRDRIVGILWPESEEDQARHTLSQTLYSLRRDAGRELIAGSSHLRLDPALSSDVGDFRAAIAAGEIERAGDLYTGRFLEGFYLPGADEFERWAEEERQSLHQAAIRTMERLSRDTGAVRAWQRLVELDPLSAKYAEGHMRALSAGGDRSGALSRARAYAEAVRRELDAEPDAAVRALEAKLRAEVAAEPLTVSPAVRRAEPEPKPQPQEPGPPAIVPHSKPWAMLATAGVAVILLVLFLFRANRSSGAATLPFLAVGDIRAQYSPDSTALGPMVRDLLATSLGALDGLQVVANSRLVELMPRGPDPAPGAMNDAARRAGATELIEGELLVEPGGLSLSFRRVAVPQGVVRRGYRVRAANRSDLVDSASAAIARDLNLAPPTVPAARYRTSSQVAYALFDEGLRAFYGYDTPAAFRLMQSALAQDSTFAMAAYYVWHLSKFLNDQEAAARVLPVVERLALRTIERERLLIQTSLANETQSTREMAALADTLTVKYPEDPDGQMLLGMVRGTLGEYPAAVTAYERAIVLDSVAGVVSGPQCRICRGMSLLSSAYTWWDSLSAAERTGRRLIRFRPGDTGPWLNLVEPLLRMRRRVEAEAALATTQENLGIWYPRSLIHRDMIRWGEFERVDRELIAEISHPNADVRNDAWWLLMISLRDQGRLREADTLIHRGRVPNTSIAIPGHSPAVDFALLGLEMGHPEVSIRAHRENVATMSKWNPPANRARNIAWQLALAGTAHAAAGDTAVVRRLADSLEALGPASNYAGRDAKLHYILRGLLLQSAGRHAEAVDAFRRAIFSLSDGYTRMNLMLARSLIALGRGSEAIPVLRPAIRGGVDGSNTYVSRTELREALALAFEQAGQPDSAVVHWREVESAWRRADSQFRERYLRAKLKADAVKLPLRP